MSKKIQTILVVVMFAAVVLFLGAQNGPLHRSAERVPERGISLPWGALGMKLVAAGVIDTDKLERLSGGLSKEQRALLEEPVQDVRMTEENAPYLLNLLWALGLANRNPILETEMRDPRYGGADGFASTGGWTIASGHAMEHYNRHPLLRLSGTQQALVEKVSRNIYRPCCDNSTHFPDCNHGMAMLALLELMASQGTDERGLYEAALVANSYWFPDQYRTLAAYFASRGVAWDDLDPKELLGKKYSSASGYARIAALVRPVRSGDPSCGV